jgi:predicted dehydrogenase/threonine dehydrogenase-like Zn-dependent dehydrogenase
MKQVLLRQGQAVVEEVPAPQVEPGTVLVRVHHSCISAGTERSSITASGQPLWRRALKKPEQVKKVLHLVMTQGWQRTRHLIASKLAQASAIGYSAAGEILEIGEGIDDLQNGMRVACAGAQCAHHAEIIRVPRNLTVPIPDAVDTIAASTVALGAIALQGVRRATPTIGETFVVLGLGVLGQLASQVLRANGCRVIGIDLAPERIELAKQLGLAVGLQADDQANIADVLCRTDGAGADGVLITAATSSDRVVAAAFQMCRKKGRVVLVGDVGLALNRQDFYAKEIDFLISTSYGPGRYDDRYEEQGYDYPLGYVRWTENRNMSAYLGLVAENRMQVKPLIGRVQPVEQAAAAYAELSQAGGQRPVLSVLEYAPTTGSLLQRVIANPQAVPGAQGKIRIAVIGTGGFATSVHLPNLLNLSRHFHLRAVVSRDGHHALAAARQFGADYAGTDWRDILRDDQVDAVLIATRHHLHAEIALAALQAGKHTLVEKPLALTTEELRALEDFFIQENSPLASRLSPLLLTGFNRRFSPHSQFLKKLVADRANPMVINYRMNAGHVPAEHWTHGPQGGGRNRGEACHIYDWFTFLTDSRVTGLQVSALQPRTAHVRHDDNFVVSLTFADGSVATLTYTAIGSPDSPKEVCEVFCDGKVLRLNNYEAVEVHGARSPGLRTRRVEKGHREELEAFAAALAQGGDWPIPWWQQVQATQIAFEVEKQLTPGSQAAAPLAA